MVEPRGHVAIIATPTTRARPSATVWTCRVSFAATAALDRYGASSSHSSRCGLGSGRRYRGCRENEPGGVFRKSLENIYSKVLTVTIESAYEWSIRPRVARGVAGDVWQSGCVDFFRGGSAREWNRPARSRPRAGGIVQRWQPQRRSRHAGRVWLQQIG
jgi:hypothetical protein